MPGKTDRHITSWSAAGRDRTFLGLAVIVVLSLFAGIVSNYYFLAGIPLVVMLGYLTLVDFRQVFYLLLFVIPFSTEVYLPNGFGTDLPTEPLMVLLMGVFLLFAFGRGHKLDGGFLTHPITLILLFHILCMVATTITSSFVFVSAKFILAKLWYVFTFFFLAGYLLKDEVDVRKMIWIIFIPLAIAVMYVLVRHAGYGFSFKDVNRVMNPFFRNHVNYACLLALFFPYLWFARGWYRRWSATWWLLNFGIVLLLAGIQFSYTRAAYVALFIAAGAYLVVRLRLVKVALLAAFLILAAGAVFVTQKYRYMAFEPEYKKTVTHYNFDNLIEATYKGEDISTMERVYRWIAGMQMNEARPWMGFGPGNFYNNYRSYTVSSFETYVSDNPERSGIHSYYLMTLVEQGFPGLFLFLALCFAALIKGEQAYHRTKSVGRRRIVMMAMLSFIIIDALLLINDMVETDKVGPFFFMNMALILNADLANRAELADR